MTNEKRPSVKRLKKRYPHSGGELIYGERGFQMLMESIRKPPEVLAKEFEQRVAKKVEWLKKYDPHSVDIYLANPY